MVDMEKEEMRELGDSMIDASKVIALSHIKVGTFNYDQDINHEKKTITTKVIMTERPKEEVKALMNIRRTSEFMEQFWSISRAEYLTVPRSIIQLMPIEWQNKMARLMEEMNDAINWHPEGENNYWVQLGTQHFEDEDDGEGRIISIPDPLQEYRHGNGYAESLFINRQKEIEEAEKKEVPETNMEKITRSMNSFGKVKLLDGELKQRAIDLGFDDEDMVFIDGNELTKVDGSPTDFIKEHMLDGGLTECLCHNVPFEKCPNESEAEKKEVPEEEKSEKQE